MSNEKWSAKEAKKAGQKFRREARNIFAEYQRDLFKKLEEVRVVIRPKPRWIPRPMWLWFADIFVDLNNPNKSLIFETPSDFLTRKHREAVARGEKLPEAEEGDDDEYEESDEMTDLLPPEQRP